MNVTARVGGKTTYQFQSYIPAATGDIMWEATIDDDPDDDVAIATTVVNP